MTGEERQYAKGEEPSDHVSCTVEMTSINTPCMYIYYTLIQDILIFISSIILKNIWNNFNYKYVSIQFTFNYKYISIITLFSLFFNNIEI